ncbi:hypothetical protein LJR164_001604 [Phenylobacterium sp. LjRoot164]|uniref:hypothetical protein n=1 Tax=unclassified Phenylobacterium TaxID=2640670 RepID=UPI003ED0BCD0
MKRCLLAALALTLALETPAFALGSGYMTTRARWTTMSAQEQAGYAMGIVDSALVHHVDDTPADTKRKLGLATCIAELKLSEANLVTMVNEGYSADASQWAFGPHIVLFQQVIKACKLYL